MITALWGSLGILLWYVLGCAVLTYIDKDKRLFEWATSGPPPSNFWFFVVVMLWPLITYLYLNDK